MRINAHCRDCKHDGEAQQKQFKEVKFLQCKVNDCKCDHKNYHFLTYDDKVTPFVYFSDPR